MKYPIIDILKLHHLEDTEKSALRAYGGKELNVLFNELCYSYIDYSSFKQKDLSKEIIINPLNFPTILTIADISFN